LNRYKLLRLSSIIGSGAGVDGGTIRGVIAVDMLEVRVQRVFGGCATLPPPLVQSS